MLRISRKERTQPDGRQEPEGRAQQLDRIEPGDRAGQTGRFEALALPQIDAVYRLARRLAGNVAEAEDLVQETYVRAFKAFNAFELRDFGIKPWLLRILYNVFCTTRSRRRREPTLLEDVDLVHAGEEWELEETSGGLASLDWDRYDEELKAAVEALQQDYRTVLLLWAVEELSYKEIAHVVGCPIGTVMSRLFRARKILMDRLAAYAERNNVPRARLKA
ncbi:MAG: sigma-70 family RNA polymerase sigma factor [Phycisphaerae bacterium]|nr:MAG: sigma-70 family RNA polymerase sigma factor [Planctomycetota bacterium]KAB2947238.1 MAG: sigma-70 family RNA polymerase sigma factor [Phycisphaerae bacterium]MBE7458066.1 sigma-70 family RNA polymerase sigma factor [Planctomycetia bacterium]MCK6464469.1 sigma-70 family RNA polymerase sigma factor [Phycisphaerae bacterium]MCL4717980.1 sigma-70 family RNA polymerase sigma factor [Phycisphaerae bacterium]